MRRHRLLELYRTRALGLRWDRVHDEAELLEHALSAELEEVIAARLGDPIRDPQGDPIPTRDGQVVEVPTESLAALAPGTVGELVRVSDFDPAMLRHLAIGGSLSATASRWSVRSGSVARWWFASTGPGGLLCRH
jgi:DtxR family Mn-dependent transcriptional regulator